MASPHRSLVVGFLLIAPFAAVPLAAQSPATASGAVLLEVRPHAGDTVSARLEQSVEMTGTRRIGGRDSTARVTSSMIMLARTMVETVAADYSVVAMRTDSVQLSSSDDHEGEMRARAERALRGTTSRLRLLPDGTAEGLDGSMGVDGSALLAVMPGTLPNAPVAVGGRWTRTMTIPAVSAAKGAGQVKTTFRLDSVTAGGRFAWISMKGTLRRDESAPLAGTGERAGALSGSLVGGMTLDRRRGWVVATWTDMTVKSTVTTPGAPNAPLRVTVRVMQRMRAEDRE
ncbi:MAG: hypothetical protein HOQ11_00760 [Gemmatimonadaceae bacterium]|nr:hypothetical protein [Gemmatimonadaceae bacterium]NUQ92632.1 hypothetical protein [Gemmatimonadaceae bacterium]NUS95918.1 hypothetical protein [Gemmatimonadaceae bacterium]